MFVFADKLLHFISFLSFGDFRFSWTCVVSLCFFLFFWNGFSQGLVLSILGYCFVFLRKPQMFYIQNLCFSSVLSLLSFFRIFLKVTFWNDQILFATTIVKVDLSHAVDFEPCIF